MKIPSKPIKNPSLESILVKEYRSFARLHQPSMQSIEELVVNGSLSSFFAREIFPIAATWIKNITEVVMLEMNGTMSVKVLEDWSFSKEEQIKIRCLVEKSKQINCGVALLHMKEKLPNFVNKFGFNIGLFLPLWWMGVKEAWHRSLIQSVLNSLSEAFDEKSEVNAGVLNFTDKEIPPELMLVLSKGRKYIPHINENAEEAVERFETEILEQAIWYRHKIGKGRKKRFDNVEGLEIKTV
jgi:hypothetical protein